ncbi:tetratricopeptide repeat protein [Mucilaginibacter agri]|uniref:Tetratricopeptide repeat protein n=1 Tax=Mucilaginibacter agri TaxID=2695265 RepID=A0A966DW03_9SPHI|nr:hypothetical protein [Mucilaginibacter agri]NCD71992.1 hypothetical protein [Mucilaginibacter agri]
MDTYYTLEEKYLLAVEELKYGETPKSLQLLNEIISNDPLHARAHFQLGKIHYYDLNDYQTAGFHFKTANELEPNFPDLYFHYMHLLQFLQMEKNFEAVKAKAVTVPGVNLASIYLLSGLIAERHRDWTTATAHYRNAFLEVTDKALKEEIEESLKRVSQKARKSQGYNYTVVD